MKHSRYHYEVKEIIDRDLFFLLDEFDPKMEYYLIYTYIDNQKYSGTLNLRKCIYNAFPEHDVPFLLDHSNFSLKSHGDIYGVIVTLKDLPGDKAKDFKAEILLDRYTRLSYRIEMLEAENELLMKRVKELETFPVIPVAQKLK